MYPANIYRIHLHLLIKSLFLFVSLAVSFAPSVLVLSIAFVWTSVTSAGVGDKRSSSIGHVDGNRLQSEFYPGSETNSGQQFWKRLVSSMFAPQPQLRLSPNSSEIPA